MILIIGANGQLGSELKERLKDKAIYTDREELDITQLENIENFFQKNLPSIVINCSVFTAVDKAEEMKKEAFDVNAKGVENLAKMCKKVGAKFIHISTDYVFDGTNHKPYIETDATNPTSIYGETKLEGEKLAFKFSETLIIIRTSWLYSSYGNNFVKTMIRLGKDRENLGVIFDQVGTPTYAGDLADAIIIITEKLKVGTKEIYNYSNEGVASWYDFAKEIMEQKNINCDVKPIETKDYPTPAKRPFYSVLNKAKIKKDFEIKITHWKEGLQKCLKKLF